MVIIDCHLHAIGCKIFRGSEVTEQAPGLTCQGMALAKFCSVLYILLTPLQLCDKLAKVCLFIVWSVYRRAWHCSGGEHRNAHRYSGDGSRGRH